MKNQFIYSIGDIKREIIRLRALPGMWRTNLFASDEELERWCTKVGLSILSTERSFFLLHHRATFCHAFFCTVDLADAEKTLRLLPQTVKVPISMDLLGEDDDLRAMLAQVGFHCAATLKRMTRPNEEIQAEDIPLKDEDYARLNELPFLMDQLQNNFSPLTKQIPDKAELSQMIQEKSVFTMRTPNNDIVGILVFERQRATILLRYIVVMEKWRGKSLGGMLVQKFLGIRQGIRKHQLWVKSDNCPAIRLYEKYGFCLDGLYDDVYVFLK